MLLDRLLEVSPMAQVLFVLSVAYGVVISIVLMQLTESSQSIAGDNYLMRSARRASLAAVAIAFLWCLSYSVAKDWEPWPPMVGLIWAFNFNLTMRAITTRMRERALSRSHKSVVSTNGAH